MKSRSIIKQILEEKVSTDIALIVAGALIFTGFIVGAGIIYETSETIDIPSIDNLSWHLLELAYGFRFFMMGSSIYSDYGKKYS